MVSSSTCKDRNVPTKEAEMPECCLTCGNYKPKFWRIIGKECAAFGTVKGVKNNRCGAWCKT